MANKRSCYQVATLVLSIYTHMLVVSITILVLYWLIRFREGFSLTSPNKFKIFNLHPLLMVLGFIIFSGEAMITYKAIPAKKQSLKIIHLIFHLIALGAGILGIYAVFKFHNEMHIAHMYTLHSWIGLSTICLFGLQLLLGIISFLIPWAKTATRAKILPWHVFIGVVIFFMAIVSATTGIAEVFIFQDLLISQEARVVNFIGMKLLLFGISVGLIVVLPLRSK